MKNQSKGNIVIGGFVLLFIGLSLSYLALFTSPLGKAPSVSGSKLKILGDSKLIYSQSQGFSTCSGGPDVCADIKPGCEEAFVKRSQMNGYFDPAWDDLTVEERSCLIQGCLRWEANLGSLVETEKVYLELTGDQITELIKIYKPDSVKASNVRVWIENNKIYGSAVSSYSMLPGVISAEAEIDNHWFVVRQAYLGRISAPQSIVDTINSGVESLFQDFFAKVGVYIEEIDVVNDKLAVKAEAPKGLLRLENGVLIVDNNVFAELEKDNENNKDEGDFNILNIQ